MAECKHAGIYDGPQMNILMASEDTSKDGTQFICGICLENYTKPRKPHNFPENNEVTLDWIQTFPLNTVIIKMMESLPKTSRETKEVRRDCDACKEGGEITVAVKFCLDCKETMCDTCTKCHVRFKATSGHTLINITEIPTEANCAGFFDTFTKCLEHPDREIDLYCKSHDVVICALCALDYHGKPCTVVDVSSYNTDAAKLREESEKLTSQMREMIDHINLLQKLKKENTTNLKQKLKEIKERIHQVRDEVVTVMDNVVSHVTNVAKQIEIKHEDELNEEITRVSKMKELIEEKVSLLDTVEKHGSERHKFISAHLMKSQIEDIGRQISEEDKRLRNVDAELKVADDIRKLIDSTDVEKLVQVTVNESESDHKHFGAVLNYLRDSKLVMVDKHTVRPNAECYPNYSGAAIYRDGRVILSDSCDDDDDCGYLCLYNPTNRTMLKLKLNRPYSATQIDDTHIAVSIPDDKTISIVNVGNELRVEKTLNTQNEPNSIVALNNGQVAVSWDDPAAFSVIDINGTEIIQKSYMDQDNSGRKFRSFNYLAVDEKRQHVIQSCEQDEAVYCFDFTGEPVFKYTDPGLTIPQGVALDRCGNIYVCAYDEQGSIHKLSPAGEPISIIYVCEYTYPGSIHKVSPAGLPLGIITEGVSSFPQAICTDRDGTGFWVTRISNEEVVYFRLEQNTGT